MKISVTLTLDVDVVVYAREYGFVDSKAAEADAREHLPLYVAESVQSLPLVRSIDAQIALKGARS